MIMVIGGRCQGKSSFAREHFESRIQENKKIEKDGETQKDHLENLKTDPWTDGETATWEEFLASAWSRNFHLLVRRILKKDETLGLDVYKRQNELCAVKGISLFLHGKKRRGRYRRL